MAARVLVVEDNPANLALMDYLLKAFGYTVLSAADGAEGVTVALREHPDMVLMDLQMPMLNGYEAVVRLRQDPTLAATPIVAVTAQAMVGDREPVLAHGFTGYIAKPIAPETFVREVEQYLPASLRRSSRTP